MVLSSTRSPGSGRPVSAGYASALTWTGAVPSAALTVTSSSTAPGHSRRSRDTVPFRHVITPAG